VLVEGRKLFLSAASAIERDAWCVRVWTRALSPIALPPQDDDDRHASAALAVRQEIDRSGTGTRRALGALAVRVQ
jgi:hypothetical protein